MRIRCKALEMRYLVEFSPTEAGELRAIGHLPPRYEAAAAELWLSSEEIAFMAELPVSAELQSAITTIAAMTIAGWP